MSRKNFSIIFIIIFSSLITSYLLPQQEILNEMGYINTSSLSDTLPSKYQIKQSITYLVEINFSVTQLSSFANYYFKMPRLNDRQPNSPYTPMCPPYQESELLYLNISGNLPSQTILNYTDRFNNVYDSYNATLNFSNPEVKLSSKYLITLNEIAFDNILPSEIGSYNTSEDIFELYCNQSVEFYNRSDPNLISLSNSIVNPADSPVVKAQKIMGWISDNIEYNGSLGQEIGASSAYGNLSGDCSEYSSLMITLLRIQGIPARKVTGFCLSNNYNFKPEIGDEYTFYMRDGETPTLLGHAWVEYYVPNIGWIACDPTWHQVTNSYFNRIDYLRLNYNIGEWFFVPPDEYFSEFPVPYFFASGLGAYSNSYEFQLKVTVLDTNYFTIDLLLLIIIFSVITAIILLTVIVLYIRKRRKSKF